MDNINNINKTRIPSPFLEKGAPNAGFVNVGVEGMHNGEQSDTLGLLSPMGLGWTIQHFGTPESHGRV